MPKSRDKWQPVLGYEGFYECDRLWNIYSLPRKYCKWRKLKPIMGRGWYLSVDLSKNWVRKKTSIHRIIASTFLWLDITNKDMIVCHKDDNPANNNVSNLFLWDQNDNIQDMMSKNRHCYWSKVWTSKLNKKDVLDIVGMLNNWKWLREISNLFWVSDAMIWNIKNKKSWKHLDYEVNYTYKQVNLKWSKVHNSKFTDKEVRKIRSDYSKWWKTHRWLAKTYWCSDVTINNLLSRKTYKYVN